MDTEQRESAILHMADIHYGKETRTYRPGVFTQRMDAVGKRLIRLRDLLGQQIDELIVSIAGDANDGTDIYKTQAHHQAETNVEEQAHEFSDIMTGWLLWQKQYWGKVRVEAVPGNHGRAGVFAHEAASWDIVAYRYLRQRLYGRIDVGFNSAEEIAFIRKFRVRGHNYLLYHGHGIRMYQQIPWYGIAQRVKNWNTTSLAPFDVVLMGHFHQVGMQAVNKIDVLLTGTMASDDEWALQELGMESKPAWWFFGASDSRPITWSYRLDLE